jgi:hypothetical protein
MLAFLNDLSISPKDCKIDDNWEIVKRLIYYTTELKNYDIRKIRVPKDFINTSIAGSHSLAYYAKEAKQSERLLILTLLSSRLEMATEDINNAIDDKQKENIIDVTLNDLTSKLLTEAHVMNCPSVSLSTHEAYCTDYLNCNFHVLSTNDRIITNGIKIENISNENSFNVHRAFLADWKQKILFSKTKWNPREKPIWNNHTETLLKECNFPLSLTGKVEKIPELTEIGTMVAELNAWQFDEAVSKKNKNSGQLRKIFRSKNSSSNTYLSIDFESAHGKFELHDHKGKHLGEIRFVDGEFLEDGDNKSHHDIKV